MVSLPLQQTHCALSTETLTVTEPRDKSGWVQNYDFSQGVLSLGEIEAKPTILILRTNR